MTLFTKRVNEYETIVYELNFFKPDTGIGEFDMGLVSFDKLYTDEAGVVFYAARLFTFGSSLGFWLQRKFWGGPK